jgi:hypothetical protein
MCTVSVGPCDMAVTVRKPIPELPACDEELKRRALQEVLGSSTFERAELLKRFLRYVCEMEFAGRLDEINEYNIGTEALGRPATYSPGEDSSVRSRAHAVREKLGAFYEAEGARAQVRIEFHKGSYIPHFVPRPFEEPRANAGDEAPGPAPLALPDNSTPAPSIARNRLAGFVAGAVTTALVVLLASALFPRVSADHSAAPILKEFWGPLIQPGSDVILSMATAPSMLLHSYKDEALPPTPRIIPAPDEGAKWYEGLHMQDGGGRLYSQTTMNTLLFGDSLAAAAAVRVLTGAGKAVQILPEYSVHILALRGRDVLAIGSPNYSPIAARILRDCPFSVRYDPVTRLEVVSTVSGPEPQNRYIAERDQATLGLKLAYGLITVLPSPGLNDESHRTVLFSGISSAGTEAAVEFFSSAASLRSLKSRMHIAAGGRLPSSYQVVVRCAVVNTLALDWAYETHRIIEKPPNIN